MTRQTVLDFFSAAPSYIVGAVSDQRLRAAGKGGPISPALAVEFSRKARLDRPGPATYEELEYYAAIERGDGL